jgi:hypothetical protein
VFRGQSVIQSQRPGTRCPSSFGGNVPVAVQRADHIAAAMQIEDGLGPVRVRRCCPFRLDAVGGDWLDDDVSRQFVLFAARVDVAPSLPDVI